MVRKRVLWCMRMRYYCNLILPTNTQSTSNPNPTTMTNTFSPKPLLVRDLQQSLDLDMNDLFLHYTTAQLLLKILLCQSK